jgi:hypothetical protein
MKTGSARVGEPAAASQLALLRLGNFGAKRCPGNTTLSCNPMKLGLEYGWERALHDK